MSTSRGKIGRLAHEIRHGVNIRIRDNRPAEEILSWLADEHKVSGITPQNLSAWKTHGGYERWLRCQDRLEGMEARREFALQLAREATAGGDESLSLASNAASALAVDAIQSTLEEFDPRLLKELLAEHPEKFTALVDSLAGLRKGDQAFAALRLKFDEYRSKAASLAREANRAAGAGDTEALKRIAAEMDRVLGG